MSRQKRIEKFGALGIGLLLSPTDGGIGAVRAAPATVAYLLGEGKKLPRAMKKATDRIKRDLRQAPDHGPEDWTQAEALLDRVVLTPHLLARHAADPKALTQAVCDQLGVDRDSPGGALFLCCVSAAFHSICDDSDVLQEAQPLLIRDIRQKLDRIETAPMQELVALARMFHIDPAPNDSVAYLRAQLCAKAADQHRLTDLIGRIDQRAVELADLQSAANQALSQLDFARVEAHLSRVDRMQTEMVIETRVARAINALMVDDAATAFRHLSSAADCMALPAETAMCRLDHADLLISHGDRFGGQGLMLAERMLRQAVAALDRDKSPAEWAGAMQKLGRTLAAQGSRMAGDRGIDLLHDAVMALRPALEAWTDLGNRRQQALVQIDIATALQAAGTRASGTIAITALTQAFDWYATALTMFSGTGDRQIRAVALGSMGVTLTALGCHAPDGVGLLRQAQTALLDAYEIRHGSEEWLELADILTNLALLEMAFAEAIPAAASRHLHDALRRADAAQAIYEHNKATACMERIILLRDRIQTELDRLS